MFYLNQQFNHKNFFSLCEKIGNQGEKSAFLSGSFFSFLTLYQFLFKEQTQTVAYQDNIDHYMDLSKRDFDIFYLSNQSKIKSTTTFKKIKQYKAEINTVRLNGKTLRDKIDYVSQFDEHWLKFFYDFKTKKVYFALSETMLFQLKTNKDFLNDVKDYPEQVNALWQDHSFSFTKKECLTEEKSFLFFKTMLSFLFKDSDYFFQQLDSYKGHFFENENRLLEKKAIKNLLRKHKKMNNFLLPLTTEHMNTLLLTLYFEKLLTKKNKFSVYFRDDQAKKYTGILKAIEKVINIKFFNVSKITIKDEKLSQIKINLKKISNLDLFQQINIESVNLSQLNYITEDNVLILVE